MAITQRNVLAYFLMNGVYNRNGKSNLRNRTSSSIVQSGRADKKGSSTGSYLGLLVGVMNRRTFLKTSSAMSLFTALAASGFSLADSQSSSEVPNGGTSPGDLSARKNYFTDAQHKVLDAVQMQLFPDDGNGPGVRELNAMAYLEWAMTDQKNIEDGDPEFIANGIGWLDDLSEQTHGDSFIHLSDKQQDKVLKQIAKSQAGENWLSLLMYYLAEALMLDPVYGGNPEMVGWKWLEHQAGFPRPVAGKTYRDFK
jgi:gluconate 2-dehydrogenase gamma chain